MRWLLRLVMVAAVMWVVSCSDDSERDEHSEPATTVELMPCVPAYAENWPATSDVTRAWTPPTGYYLYDQQFEVDGDELNDIFWGQKDLINNSIGIFFTKKNGIPEVLSGNFFYQSGQWRSTVEIKTDGIYQLYGYIPLEEATAIITGNSTYDEGAVMTLKGLKALTPSDVCVVVGAKEGDDAETVTGLTPGRFDYYAQSGESAHNYVFLLFDHIYSALRFCFKVDDKYNGVRTIKLRKVELKSTEEGFKANYDADITLKKRDNGSNPIISVEFKNNPDYPAVSEYVTLYNWNGIDISENILEPFKSNEVILDHDNYTKFVGRFVPLRQNSTKYTTNFILRSTYDVFDKKGNLIREGCTAENDINLSSSKLFGNTIIQRGHMYSIPLIVKPTYLYMLSEPDLDNPQVILSAN